MPQHIFFNQSSKQLCQTIHTSETNNEPKAQHYRRHSNRVVAASFKQHIQPWKPLKSHHNLCARHLATFSNISKGVLRARFIHVRERESTRNEYVDNTCEWKFQK